MDNAALQNGDAQHLPTATDLLSSDQPTSKLNSSATLKTTPMEEAADVADSKSPAPLPSQSLNHVDSATLSTTENANQNSVASEAQNDLLNSDPALGAQPTADTSSPNPEATYDDQATKEDPQNITTVAGSNPMAEIGTSNDAESVERSQNVVSTATTDELPAPQYLGLTLDTLISKPADAPIPSLPTPPPASESANEMLFREKPQEPAPTPIAPSAADDYAANHQITGTTDSGAPPIDEPSFDQAMLDASTPATAIPTSQLHVDHSMSDAAVAPPPPPQLPAPLNQPQIDHSMVDAPPSSGKASRERDDDEEHAPAAKRLKAEDESAEPEFKVPNPPAMSPSGGQSAAGTSSVSEDSVTLPRLNHMKKVIANLKKSAISAPFREPVNPAALNIPTYFDVVKQPMDLGTLDRKLKSSSYERLGDFVTEFNLIVDNAITFNGLEHAVTQSALKMRQSFENQMKALPPASFTVPIKEEKKAIKVKENPVRSTQRRVSTTSQPTPLSATGRSPVTPGSAQTFALGPEGVPLIRRDSSVTDGRPKRAIHPPKRRDQEFGPGRPRKKKFEWQLKFCKDVLNELKKPKYSALTQYFDAPVDAVALNIPTYHKIIKKPMDLDTVEKKLDTNQYEKAKDFEEDVRLIFKNCYLFNQPGDLVYSSGQQLEKVFDEKWATKEEWLNAHEPVSEPPSPGEEAGEEEPSEEEEEEDSADERSNEIALLKEQIAQMTQTIGNLQSGGPKKKKKPTPPAPTTAKKGGDKSKKKDSKSSKTGGGPTAPQPASKSKKKSNTAPSRSKPEKEHFVTLNQKHYISTGISSMPGARMSEALKIIQANVPSLKNTSETEIELDIDELPNSVLLKLLNFVKKYGEQAALEPEPARHPQPSPSVPVGYAASATGAGTKPKKNKPMSKHEQERQIQELKGKLGAYNGGQMSSDPGVYFLYYCTILQLSIGFSRGSVR